MPFFNHAPHVLDLNHKETKLEMSSKHIGIKMIPIEEETLKKPIQRMSITFFLACTRDQRWQLVYIYIYIDAPIMMET